MESHERRTQRRGRARWVGRLLASVLTVGSALLFFAPAQAMETDDATVLLRRAQAAKYELVEVYRTCQDRPISFPYTEMQLNPAVSGPPGPAQTPITVDAVVFVNGPDNVLVVPYEEIVMIRVGGLPPRLILYVE